MKMVKRSFWTIVLMILTATSVYAQDADIIHSPVKHIAIIQPINLDTVSDLQISSDGSTIAFYNRAHVNKGIEVWSVEEEPSLVFAIPIEHPQMGVYSVKISHTGRFVAVGTDTTLAIWDTLEKISLIAINDYDDFEFFRNENTFVYTTFSEDPASSKTEILDLVTISTIASFAYPVSGSIDISPDESSIVIGDTLDSHLFLLEEMQDNLWISTDLSSKIEQDRLLGVEFYNEQYLTVLFTFADDYTQIGIINIEEDSEVTERADFFSNRVLLRGRLVIMYSPATDIQIYEPVETEIIVAHDSTWYLAGITRNGDKYALLSPEGNIYIYQTESQHLEMSIAACICNVALTGNSMFVVGWNADEINIYSVRE